MRNANYEHSSVNITEVKKIKAHKPLLIFNFSPPLTHGD